MRVGIEKIDKPLPSRIVSRCRIRYSYEHVPLDKLKDPDEIRNMQTGKANASINGLFVRIRQTVDEKWEQCPTCGKFACEGSFIRFCEHCGQEIDK